MKLLQSMSMRQRLVLGGSILGVIIVAFLLLKMASAPSYSMIATGLDPAKTGKMTAALDEQGITYELRNNGTALAVNSNSTAQAQIALADAGLSTSGADGSSGLDKVTELKMGASTFQQKIAYQQGLEQTIEDTLGNVQGVSGATVSLTLPDDQLFQDEAKPTTASVVLTGESTGFDSGAIRGMANVVANSVEGLKPENVTIIDSTGTMLWPVGDGTAAAGGAVSKQAAEARFDAQLEAQLNALVAQTLGPGKGQVSVSSDLNMDKTSVEQLQYDKKGTPEEVTKETEKLKGSGAGGGTTAGTNSNVPGYAQNGAGGGGNSNYQNTKTSQKLLVGKKVSRTEVAAGAINRLTVGLAVDKSVPAADVKALQTQIASAAGINTQRGDTLSVAQMTFAKQPTATPASNGPLPSGGIFDYAKYALLGLAALLFLFFISRHLRRRENEVLADPSWLRQLEAPTPIAQLEDLEGPPPSLIVQSNPRKKQIEEVVTKEPERVAVALRTWMNEP
jgi:flagellar M-ring protein FliF